MKKFTKKGLLQKIIIAILIVFCVNFTVPTYSSADAGGVLVSPIVDFVCSMGDVIINLMQRYLVGEWGSTGAVNMSLSSFLMESSEYYSSDQYKEADISDVADSNKVNPDTDFDKGWLGTKNKYYIPVATYSPEQIFSGNVPGLDINFINPNYETGSAAKLQSTIASWYVALRNLSIVGLLCVLVYVGIRILLSSTASDKAKYKQMFTDWLIALCILFFLHYIMSFTLTLTESISNTIGGDGTYTIAVYDEEAGKAFSTNLLGLTRFKTQSKDFGTKCTYLLFYIMLIGYTVIFTWHYLKRLLMMAFLTIIAPMIALTYPIDKMGDGKAQAFNMWLKEYVYNALIQPFHLIIYTVFIGSALELVEVNLLYAIACMAFILPAEKILRKMFGFDKAPLGTMGALTGFTVGSLASKFGKGSIGGAKGTKAGNANSADSTNTRIRGTGSHGIDGIDYAENHQIESQAKGAALGAGVGTNGNEEQQENSENSHAFESESTEDEQARLTAQQIQELGDDSQEEENGSEGTSRTGDDSQEEENSSRETFRTRINNVVSANGGKKQIASKVKTLGANGAKFAVRTAMTATGAAFGAGLGLASGQGLTGAVTGAVAGKKLGSKLGSTMADIPGNIVGKTQKTFDKIDDIVNKNFDAYNGNTNFQHEKDVRKFMDNPDIEQHIRDKWTESHDGVAPTIDQFTDEMDKYRTYVDEGMTDMKEIDEARKAEKFGVTSRQSAKIALLAKKEKITPDLFDGTKKSKEKLQAKQDELIKQYKKKGYSDQDAQKQVSYVLNTIKAQNGKDNDINKILQKQEKTNTKPKTDGNSNGNTNA